MSGQKTHRRGPSDGRESDAGGARITKSATVKSLKLKRSLDFLMTAEQHRQAHSIGGGFRPSHRVTDSNATSNGTGSGSRRTGTGRSNRSVGKGRAGKLSISLESGGNHSRKSSINRPTPRSRDTSPGEGGGMASRSGSRNQESTVARSHARSGSGSQMAEWAVRKARHLCGPDELSPAEEVASFGGEKSPSFIGDTLHVSPVSRYKDEMLEALEEKPNYALIVDVTRPSMSPSPVPSGFTGVGIAIGTPSLGHPYAQLPEPDAFPVSVSSIAGPHLSTPAISLAPNDTMAQANDIALRHRLPPTKPPSGALPLPPSQSPTPNPSPEKPKPSTEKPTLPDSPIRHPFARPKSIRTANPRTRESVTSVEAYFGAEMLEASQSVSPLGVREAGGGWVNSTYDIQMHPDSNAESVIPKPYVKDFRDSNDSGIGSSTDMHMRNSTMATYAGKGGAVRRATASPPPRAPTVSSASLLVESPPPSLFSSLRRKPVAVFEDSATFGRPDSVLVVPPSPTQASASAPLSPKTLFRDSPSGLRPISSSDDSSPNATPNTLGSSDDMEAFKDLFYVPRARDTAISPTQHPISPMDVNERGFDVDDDHISDMQDQGHDSASEYSLPVDEGGWMTSGRLLSPLSSLHSMEIRGPGSEGGDAYFARGESVYDIPEEQESSRSSLERFTEGMLPNGLLVVAFTYVIVLENFRLGTVDALQLPSMTSTEMRRHSTELSLIDGEEGEMVDHPPLPILTLPIPRPAQRTPRNLQPGGPDESMIRSSFLTTTSGASNRMSHIISDFPSPPPDMTTSFLDYYGVSPMKEKANPLSLPMPYSSTSQQPLRPNHTFIEEESDD